MLAAVRAGFSLAVVLWVTASLADTTTPTIGAAPTPTPTPQCTPPLTPPVPAPCVGTKKFQIHWSARHPESDSVFLSATHCSAPAPCAEAGGTGTSGPLTLTISDATGKALATTLPGPPQSAGACPSGVDVYRSGSDQLRVIFGASGQGGTTLVGRFKVPQSGGPLALVAPITFTLRDACGYAVESATATCFTRASGTRTDIKCF